MSQTKTWEIKYKTGVIKTISGITFKLALFDARLPPFIQADVISIIQVK